MPVPSRSRNNFFFSTEHHDEIQYRFVATRRRGARRMRRAYNLIVGLPDGTEHDFAL